MALDTEGQGSVAPRGNDPMVGSGYLTKPSILGRVRSSDPNKPLIEWGENLQRDGPDLEGRVNSWFCDLHMGDQVFLSSHDQLTRLGWKEDFRIDPGDFALLLSEERVSIPPDLAAFISLRFGVALKGLINISGRHVDPGFSGKLVFSVYNAGSNPVVMRRGDPVFMITFAHLDGAAPSKVGTHFQDIDSLRSDWIERAMGPPVSLVRLSREVESLNLRFKVYFGILGAAASVIAVTFLAWVLTAK